MSQGKETETQAQEANAEELDEKVIENLLNSSSKWGNKAREMVSLLKDISQVQAQTPVASDDIFNTLLKFALIKSILEPDPNTQLLKLLLTKQGRDGNSSGLSTFGQFVSSIRTIRNEVNDLRELLHELTHINDETAKEVAKEAAQEVLQTLSPEALSKAVNETITYKSRMLDIVSSLIDKLTDSVIGPLLRNVAEDFMRKTFSSPGSGAIDVVLQQLGGGSGQGSVNLKPISGQNEGGVGGGNTVGVVQSYSANTATAVSESRQVGSGGGAGSQPKPESSAGQATVAFRPKVDLAGVGASRRRVVNKGGV